MEQALIHTAPQHLPASSHFKESIYQEGGDPIRGRPFPAVGSRGYPRGCGYRRFLRSRFNKSRVSAPKGHTHHPISSEVFLSHLKTLRSIFISEDFCSVPPFHSCFRDVSHNHASARSHLDQGAPPAPSPKPLGAWNLRPHRTETLTQTRAEAPGVNQRAARKGCS